MDIENILISNKIFSGDKYYEYFLGYMHNDFRYMDDDYKFKPFSIILSKMSAYTKIYDSETK